MCKNNEYHCSFQDTSTSPNPMILLYIFLIEILHRTDLEITS